MSPRYALYAAPERDTRLWHFGNRVLGRDAETEESIPQIVPAGFSAEDWQSFTASPRRYGFHATLKAPFFLAEQHSEAELLEAVRGFSARFEPIEDLAIAPVLSGTFVILAPVTEDPRVRALADAAVTEFDAFRAALSDEDRERRLNAELSERQKENLDRWGYPFVFEDFAFHLTLAGPLPDIRRDEALAALTAGYQQAVKAEALAIRSLAVFAEPAPGEPFRLVQRAPLGAPGNA